MKNHELPLFPPAAATPRRPRPRKRLPGPRSGSRPRRRILWLCLRLPDLPFEAVAGTWRDAHEPCLVVTGEGAATRVIGCNQAALTAGVRPRMRLSDALARVHAPILQRRNPDRERASLENVAQMAEGFSSLVSLAPPAAVLLEIGGSLSLFGGIAALRRRLETQVAAAGHLPVMAIAPTPLAAEWLARAGDSRPVTDTTLLAGRLGELSPDCLAPDPGTARTLAGIGVRRLADVMRLPRDGLGRRFGAAFVRSLDRALGRVPDPRPGWRGALSFEESLELPAETGDRERIMAGLEPLLESAVSFLRRHDSTTDELRLYCRHHGGEETPIRLGLAGNYRHPDHLARLFRVRLERVALTRAVRALRLVSGPLRAYRGRSVALFREADSGEEVEALFESLHARLGPDAVHTLATCADHRPERAWRLAGSDVTEPEGGRADRPCWLLETPRMLEEGGGIPGDMTLLAGPERIETGWWEGADVARDYYRARSRAGRELWIFRDRRAGVWYLHGLFA